VDEHDERDELLRLIRKYPDEARRLLAELAGPPEQPRKGRQPGADSYKIDAEIVPVLRESAALYRRLYGIPTRKTVRLFVDPPPNPLFKPDAQTAAILEKGRRERLKTLGASVRAAIDRLYSKITRT
jgi:hypothetical protein